MRQILLGITILLSIYSSPLQAQVDVQDSLTLVDIYNSTGGPNWTNHTNWLTANPVSTWHGVTVRNGRVTRLDLYQRNLSGRLPNISALTSLEYLNLAINKIEHITDLSSLKNLKELNCSTNPLNELPRLNGLTSLLELYCANNELVELPNLDSLRNLKVLNCKLNKIDSLPQLSNLVNLEEIDCQTNWLTKLPDLDNLVNLKILDCSKNSIKKLPKLEENRLLEILNCFNNELTNLPDLSQLHNLEYLNFSYNEVYIIPIIPEHGNLIRLSCDNNSLKKLPNISNNIRLKEIYCNNNFLERLPILSKLVDLKTLVCHSNELIELPDLSNLITLHTLAIMTNALSFEDIEPILKLPISNSNAFNFSSQTPDTIPLIGDIRTYIDSTYTLRIDRRRGENTVYEWFKDDVSLGESSLDTFLHIPQVSVNDAGIYRCVATNPLIPEITQYSVDFEVEVLAVDSLGGIYYPNQFLVEYEEGTSYAERQVLQEEFGATVIDSCMCGQQLEVWQIPEAIFIDDNGETHYVVDDDGKKKRIRRKSKINGADFQYVINSDAWSSRTASAKTDRSTFYKKRKKSTTNSPIKIGVLDTGLDIFDEASTLFPYRWVNPNEDHLASDQDGNCYQYDIHGISFEERDSIPDDDHPKYHGSHIAEIIKQGFQPEDIELMAIKTHNKDGLGTIFNTVCGIYYAMEKDVDIINASWSYKGLPSEILENAIRRVGEQSNTLFIASAGNDATLTDTVPYYPASYDLDNILSVMSIDDKDRIPTFSNYGQHTIDLAARGFDIRSERYGIKNGTSLSTAYVSGFAARLLHLYPNLSPIELKQLLFEQLEYLPVLNGKCLTKSKLPDSFYEAFELVDFQAVVENEEMVVLDWSTLFEVDLDSFEVERSFDNINFVNIGKVIANNQTQNGYQFEDDYTLIDSLTSYYRIKINEKSGKHSYSQTKKILAKEVPIIEYDFVVELLGNQIKTTLNLLLQEEVNDGFIHIYDVSGKLIHHQNISGVAQTALSIPLHHIASGNYLIRIFANQEERSYRFQKLKD